MNTVPRPSDGSRRARRRRILTLAAAVTLLGALMLISALMPDPEERRVRSITEWIVSGDLGTMNPADRDAFRRDWENLPPDTRQAVMRSVGRHQLAQWREQRQSLTPEQRQQAVREAVDEMRRRRAAMTPDELRTLRERAAQPDSREAVAEMMRFYQQELTAAERAEIDPLVHEWLIAVDQAFGR